MKLFRRGISIASHGYFNWENNGCRVFRRCYASDKIRQSPSLEAPERNTIKPDKFRSIMRNVPSPVVVVTTVGDHNDKFIKRGITCSSFTSVSSDPAIISFCVNQPSRIHAMLMDTQHFAVHVLADDQVNHSIFFSKPSIDGINQFQSIPHVDGLYGVPIIDNVAAVLQCEAHQTHQVGDHSVWYGSVIDCYENDGKNPLLYYNRTFRNLGDQAFMDAFERAQLKFKDWTHEAHLRMAWNYLTKHTLEEAIPLIRNGIQKFNQQNMAKVKRGYHQTITMFYIHFVNLAISSSQDCASFEEFVVKNEYLLNKDLIFIYYSKDVLFSDQAKKEFVPPDKCMFPDS